MTADVASAESAAAQVVATLVRDISQAIALLVVCALIDIRLVIAAAIVVPGTLVPVRRFAARLRAIGRQQLEAQAEVALRAEQMLQGHRIVSAYNGQAFENRRFGRASAALLGVMRVSLRLRAAYSPTMEGLGVVAMALAIAYAGRAVVAGRMPPEAVISFAAAALMLYQPLKALGNLGQQLAQLRAAADRAFEILDAPDGIRRSRLCPRHRGACRSAPGEGLGPLRGARGPARARFQLPRWRDGGAGGRERSRQEHDRPSASAFRRSPPQGACSSMASTPGRSASIPCDPMSATCRRRAWLRRYGAREYRLRRGAFRRDRAAGCTGGERGGID